MKEQIGPTNGITLGVRFRIVNAFELDSTEGKTYATSIIKTQLGVPYAQFSGKPLFFPVPVLTNFWPPKIIFMKTQRIRNKPSNYTIFLQTLDIRNQRVQKKHYFEHV